MNTVLLEIMLQIFKGIIAGSIDPDIVSMLFQKEKQGWDTKAEPFPEIAVYREGQGLFKRSLGVRTENNTVQIQRYPLSKPAVSSILRISLSWVRSTIRTGSLGIPVRRAAAQR